MFDVNDEATSDLSRLYFMGSVKYLHHTFLEGEQNFDRKFQGTLVLIFLILVSLCMK